MKHALVKTLLVLLFLMLLAPMLIASLTWGTEGAGLSMDINNRYEKLSSRYRQLLLSVRELRGMVASEQLPESEASETFSASQAIPTLEYWLEETGGLLKRNKTRTAARKIDEHLKEAENLAEDIRNNRDPFKNKKGLFQKAYRSNYDSMLQPFSVFVPQNYEGKKTPLIVALHGMFSDHWQIPRAMRLDKEPERMPWLVVSPYGRGSMGYWGPAERDVWDVLSIMQRNYNVDPDRIYITGLSMGGFGTFHMAMTQPDRFAAAAPICGAGHTELALNALWVPFYIFHGEKDNIVPFSCSTDMQQAIAEQGYDVQLKSYPEAEHDSWTPTYGGEELFKWFAGKKRVTTPEKVSYRTKNLRFNKTYWLTIDGLNKYGQFGEIQAEIQNSEIHVTTKNISSFSIDFSESPISPGTQIRIIHRGSLLHDGPASGILSLQLVEKEKTTKPYKRKNLSGPLLDVAYDKFLYVYGTQSEDPVRNEVAKQEALAAADWGELVREQFPVKPDFDVNPVDLADYNLILFGDPSCNKWLAEMQAQMPVKFEEGFIQVGDSRYEGEDIFVVYIYPNPLTTHRYVVVIAGVGPEALKQCHELNFYNNDSDLFVFNRSFLQGQRSITKKLKPTRALLALSFDDQWKIPRPNVK